MPLRAFPVIYARDVEAVAAFYLRLGMQCDGAELAVLVALAAPPQT